MCGELQRQLARNTHLDAAVGECLDGAEHLHLKGTLQHTANTLT